MKYKNNNHLYFTIKGVKFMLTGTKVNKNGSYTHSIKNCENEETFKHNDFRSYKDISDVDMMAGLKKHGIVTLY